MAWARAVDVIRIGQGQTELRGYIQLESLLANRTIFLQDDEVREEVARFRDLARQCVDEGHALYSGVASRIDDVRRLVDDVSLPVSPGSPSLSHVYPSSFFCQSQLDETRILAGAAEDIYDVNV